MIKYAKRKLGRMRAWERTRQALDRPGNFLQDHNTCKLAQEHLELGFIYGPGSPRRDGVVINPCNEKTRPLFFHRTKMERLIGF